MARTALLTVAVCVLLGASCDAYSRGAPEGACETQEPLGHTGARRNPAPNPYSLSAPAQAKPADTITVDLSGANFKGYMIQAVTAGGAVVGAFEGSNLSCNPTTKERDTATHSGNEVKQTAQLKWVAPPNIDGLVYFRGTVVQDYNNFYTNIYSNPVTFGSSPVS